MRPERWLFTVPLRLRSLFRRAADQALDDELRDHLELATAEYVAKGMTQEEAHRRARIDLDGIEQTKEKCPDAHRVNWIQDRILDLRYDFANAGKEPRVHSRRNPDASPRDWCKHCHLQLYQRLDYETVALSAIRPFDGSQCCQSWRSTIIF